MRATHRGVVHRVEAGLPVLRLGKGQEANVLQVGLRFAFASNESEVRERGKAR